MCGIIGYVGRRDVAPVLLESLRRVTYRGYDSFGVALTNGAGIRLYKSVGVIEQRQQEVLGLQGSVGIGHTRWATVGKVSDANAHPHLDCAGRFAIIHNGDLDNFHVIKQRLVEKGHRFTSETDSEVIAHLLEQYDRGDLTEALRRAVKDLEGSYAIVAMRAGARELAVARRGSPAVIALGEHEVFIASDVPAILPYTDRVMYLEDGDVGRLTEDSIEIWSNGGRVTRPLNRIEWSPAQLDMNGYEHYMLKEIHEQPWVVRDTLAPYLDQEHRPVKDLLPIANPGRIIFLGCGTSYHACLLASRALQDSLDIPMDVQVASEYQDGHPSSADSLVIALSQSGETADTVSAVRRAAEAGCRTLAITNVRDSSITRVAERSLYTHAGPEVAVAATKTFLAQVVSLYLVGAALSDSTAPTQISPSLLRLVPNLLRQLLSDTSSIEDVGKGLAKFEHLLLIARGLNYPVALEGALKFKEVPYIHAEGFPAGELKHGAFALLDPNFPIIALVPRDQHRTRMLTALREIKARESRVVAIASDDDQEVKLFADTVLPVAPVDPLLTPLLNTVVLQLLAYYAAREKGCPIDRPRNLAKSVTVP
jgi:glucosamine--fructose-6-phosphate aminotransferase (isomerizing)